MGSIIPKGIATPRTDLVLAEEDRFEPTIRADLDGSNVIVASALCLADYWQFARPTEFPIALLGTER